MNTNTNDLKQFFADRPLTAFTYGCMSLGKDPANFTRDIRVARMAMDSGVWFHASQEYAGGGAFGIMRHAFEEDRAHRPRLILKIRCDHAAILKFDVEDALRRLNVERVDIAQLCRGKHDERPVVNDFINKGDMWQVCDELQKSGKVGQYVMEVFASFSSDAIRAVNAGLFPGYIFYFSPGDRQANNELFRLLEQRNEPILSLRTMCGGYLEPANIQALRERKPDDPMIARFEALEPIFKQSGCATRTEFSFSFLKSFPSLLTTIAGTAQTVHLQDLLDADRIAKPMAPALVQQIKALHEQWNN
jgi:aryl-alcohol dehydrogenase-like predicted oxidoreductase